MTKVIENLEIIDYTHLGLGIAKFNNQVIFIENVLVGEIVDIQIDYHKNKIAYGSIVKFKKSSENRSAPPCPHYRECGGCNLMHLKYKEQLRLKKKIVSNLVYRQKISINLKDFQVKKNPDPLKYRNKVTFTFFQKNQKITLGFNKTKSNHIIEVHNCLLITNNMNKIKNIVLEKVNMIAGAEKEFKKLTIRENEKDEIMLIFDLNIFKYDTVKYLTELLKEYEEIVGISFSKKGETQFIKKKDFKYKLEDKRFIVSPESFFQVNTKQALNIYNDIKMLINPKHKNIIDTYSGVGSIGIYSIAKNQNLISIELNPKAVKNAILNAKGNNISNSQFFCLDLEKDLLKLETIPNFTFDTILIDPPRKGISTNFMNLIIKALPKEIIYVSCSPQTLIRDLNILIKYGYRLTFFQGYDMFSQTTHLETISKLELE